MIISFFHHSGDNEPAHVEVTWEQLAESLKVVRSTDCTLQNCARSNCKHKDGPSWCAAQYLSNTRRATANVVDVHAFIADLDHVSPDDLPAALENVSKYKCILTSSHSDREKDRCLRVIMAVSRPVLAKEWYRFWKGTVALLGLPADQQVKDNSRLYFLPSRPSDACHLSEDGNGYTYECSDGEVLDVDSILATVPEETFLPSDDFEIPDFTGAPSQKALETAITTLAGAWPEKGRNTCQLALCGALARAGWPVELIADFVEAVCELAHPGNGDRTKRLKAARASVEKVQRGEFIAGWPTVEEYVDPDTVKTAMKALGLGAPQFDSSFVEAMGRVVHDNSVSGLGTLVTVSRDDVHSTLLAAKRKLKLSSSAKKIKEGKLLDRALEGKPFTEHAEDDADAAFIDAVKAIIRYAPRGSSDIILAEYLAKSRPDIPVDALCQMVSQARSANTDDDRADLPPNEFVLETSGPRMGKPAVSAQHNFDVALRRLDVSFHHDAFARKRIVERKVGESLYRETSVDRHINGLMLEIERQFDFYPPKEKFYDYCTDRAYINEFHPVLNYLDGLEAWDGVQRAERWLIDFGGAEDTPYVRAVSRLVLTAAVRRVRKPGCKFDEMLILESPQGSGKSSLIKALCPDADWFADNIHLDGDTKKMIEQTNGKWIVEAGELRGMSSRDHNTLKAYLSSTADEARMAYRREAERVPRQFIIIGTTNDTQYLRDPTGDRRYWPVEVNRLNVEGLQAVINQLWAEASYLEAANPDADYIRLHPSLYEAAALEQSHRKVDNAVRVRLEEYLGDKSGKIKATDVWKLLTEDQTPQQALVLQAANAMHELGWQKKRSRKKTASGYYYVKGDDNVMLTVTGNMSFGLTVKTVDIDKNDNPVTEQVTSKVSTN